MSDSLPLYVCRYTLFRDRQAIFSDVGLCLLFLLVIKNIVVDKGQEVVNICAPVFQLPYQAFFNVFCGHILSPFLLVFWRFPLRTRTRARTSKAVSNFSPFFPRAHDGPVLSTLCLGFQIRGDFGFGDRGVSWLPSFFCYGNFSFMVFIPVAPRTNYDRVRLPVFVVLRQGQVWPLPYFVDVVDNGDGPPVVAAALLLPWLA